MNESIVKKKTICISEFELSQMILYNRVVEIAFMHGLPSTGLFNAEIDWSIVKEVIQWYEAEDRLYYVSWVYK